MKTDMKELYKVMREQQKKIEPMLVLLHKKVTETAELWRKYQ